MAHRITSPFGTVYVDEEHPNPLIEALGGASKRTHRHEPISMTPEVDIYESESDFTVWMDLPGVDKDSIRVSVSGVNLAVNAETKRLNQKGGHWIRHERPVGEYVRSLHLGVAVDPDSVTANYADGTLKIKLAKRTKSETMQVKVNIE